MKPTCKWFQLCPIKRYHELGKIESEWVERYCRGDWERCVRYELEERGEPHPDWMLPDGTMDERLARY
jgi:DNA polymerase